MCQRSQLQWLRAVGNKDPTVSAAKGCSSAANRWLLDWPTRQGNRLHQSHYQVPLLHRLHITSDDTQLARLFLACVVVKEIPIKTKHV